MPHFDIEREVSQRGPMIIAGIDEVGRGSLAGPVVAAAVILDEGRLPSGLDDSKRIRPAARIEIAAAIGEMAQVGLGEAAVDEISAINILQATFLAMRRAVAALPVQPDFLLVDGHLLPEGLPCPARAVVSGDRLSLSIAAASIMAKVARDRGMVDLAQQHSQYGWERNVGYGTPEHLMGLKRHGATPHHRRTFRPVRNILYQAN